LKRRWIATSVVGVVAAAVALTSTVAQAAEARDYVVLGDSYASGLGAGGTYRDEVCYQSEGKSYPARWVAKRGRAAFGDTIVNRSCSGATVADVRNKQLGDLDDETGWVTVTVGGNDIGFAGTLISCRFSSDTSCAAAVRAGIGKANSTLPGTLSGLFDRIRAEAPNAKVYVVGYPHLITSGTLQPGCPFNAYKQQQLNHGADVLAEVIRNRVAGRKNFTFVDGRTIFAGHEACSPAPWIRTALDTRPATAMFHPNQTGYEEYAHRLKQITG
jgi:lysophospholipase L1-like esterase